MGLFTRNRDSTAAPVQNAPANGATSGRGGFFNREKNHSHNHHEHGYYNRRPSFGQWLKATWLDLVSMVCMGVLGLGIYEAKPAANRLFPITFIDGEVVYPEFA